MLSSRRFLPVLCTATAAVMLSTATGFSQSETEAPTGTTATADSTGWGVQCNNDGSGLQCAASMDVVAAPDNQRIFNISFQEAQGEANPTLVMQLPFGLNLPRGVDLRVDGGEAQTFQVSTCLQTGCFIVQEADTNLIDAMIAGDSLSVTMEPSNGGETVLELSLIGFSEAISRLN